MRHLPHIPHVQTKYLIGVPILVGLGTMLINQFGMWGFPIMFIVVPVTYWVASNILAWRTAVRDEGPVGSIKFSNRFWLVIVVVLAGVTYVVGDVGFMRRQSAAEHLDEWKIIISALGVDYTLEGNYHWTFYSDESFRELLRLSTTEFEGGDIWVERQFDAAHNWKGELDSNAFLQSRGVYLDARQNSFQTSLSKDIVLLALSGVVTVISVLISFLPFPNARLASLLVVPVLAFFAYLMGFEPGTANLFMAGVTIELITGGLGAFVSVASQNLWVHNRYVTILVYAVLQGLGDVLLFQVFGVSGIIESVNSGVGLYHAREALMWGTVAGQGIRYIFPIILSFIP